MNVLPVCILYTQDPALVRKVSGFLYSLAVVRHVEVPTKLENTVGQCDPALLFFDLRGQDFRGLLPRILRDHPDSLIIAFGLPRSDPAMKAESMGVYAVEGLDFTRHHLQTLLNRCHAHLELIKENRVLKHNRQAGSTAPSNNMPRPEALPAAGLPPMPLSHFSRAIRNFENMSAMLESIVEGVASYARVSRVGLFTRTGGSDSYVMHAGVQCLEDTSELEVPDGSPLVRWMQMHAHLISRTALIHIEDTSERMLLEQCLDTLGAEVIIPLHGRNGLPGWLFLGRRVTGLAFRPEDLEKLMMLGEYVSVTLENALLHEEVAVQKTLAETMLHSVPVGIVAVAADGTVRWFNSAAEHILGVPAAEAMNQPAGNMASRLAGVLAQCLKEGPSEEPLEWVDPITTRSLSVSTRRLEDGSTCLGAVAIIIDMTREERLRKRQNEIERAAFWAELASAMSHAVRNPLVAISTFAQLLPERYNDEEFRTQFGHLVSREISRLDVMIDQLSDFAHPPPLDFRAAAIDSIIEKAVERALQRNPHNRARIDIAVDSETPQVLGDTDALSDALTHLITNAIEAVEKVQQPAIRLAATRALDKNKPLCVVSVEDNGRGISAEVRQNLFSPFCTEKVRGIGLGLPIVRRIVQDHSAELDIQSDETGTSISLQLPAAEPSSRPTTVTPPRKLQAELFPRNG